MNEVVFMCIQPTFLSLKLKSSSSPFNRFMAAVKLDQLRGCSVARASLVKQDLR